MGDLECSKQVFCYPSKVSGDVTISVICDREPIQKLTKQNWSLSDVSSIEDKFERAYDSLNHILFL